MQAGSSRPGFGLEPAALCHEFTLELLFDWQPSNPTVERISVVVQDLIQDRIVAPGDELVIEQVPIMDIEVSLTPYNGGLPAAGLHSRVDVLATEKYVCETETA